MFRSPAVAQQPWLTPVAQYPRPTSRRTASQAPTPPPVGGSQQWLTAAVEQAALQVVWASQARRRPHKQRQPGQAATPSSSSGKQPLARQPASGGHNPSSSPGKTASPGKQQPPRQSGHTA